MLEPEPDKSERSPALWPSLCFSHPGRRLCRAGIQCWGHSGRKHSEMVPMSLRAFLTAPSYSGFRFCPPQDLTSDQSQKPPPPTPSPKAECYQYHRAVHLITTYLTSSCFLFLLMSSAWSPVAKTTRNEAQADQCKLRPRRLPLGPWLTSIQLFLQCQRPAAFSPICLSSYNLGNRHILS